MFKRTRSIKFRALGAGLSVLLAGVVAPPAFADPPTPTTAMVPAGITPNGPSWGVAMSSDGRYVAFASAASNLVSADTNGVADVFRWDRDTGTALRVSVASGGAQGNGASGGSPANAAGVSMSPDGRYVAFQSTASNFSGLLGDLNGKSDVFVRDVVGGTTERASVTGLGILTLGASTSPSISADGNHVAFTYDGNDIVDPLLGGDSNGVTDIYVRDREAKLTVRVSVSASGGQTNGAAVRAQLSADGRKVVFTSAATNLFEGGDGNGTDTDVIMRDLDAGTNELISKNSDGAQANAPSTACCLSPDARVVAFRSTAGNLGADPTGSAFLRDRSAGTTDHVRSGTPRAFTDDGKTVVISTASNELWAVSAADEERIDVPGGGTGSDAGQSDPDPTAPFAISKGGNYVAFHTTRALAAGHTGGETQVYQRDRQVPATPSDLSYQVTPTSVRGPGHILPVADIPAELLPLPGGEIASLPLASIPLASIPLASIPLASIPLASIPLASIPLASIPLASIPLASIPIPGCAGWDDALAGTDYQDVPLQHVTLRQVLIIDPLPECVAALRLDHLDVRDSPLASIPLAALSLGAVPLASIPLEPGLATAEERFAAWCALLDSHGFSCSALEIEPSSTLLTLAVLGVSLRSIPLASIPLASIADAFDAASVAEVPLRPFLAQANLGVKTVPLAELTGDLDRLFDCSLVDCSPSTSDTVTEAVEADAVRTAAQLRDFVSAVPSTVMLTDLMVSLLLAVDYPVEEYAKSFADAVDPGETVAHTISFTLEGEASADLLRIDVDTPGEYVDGSGQVTVNGTAATGFGTPTTPGPDQLSWDLADAVPTRPATVTLAFATKAPDEVDAFTPTAVVDTGVAFAVVADPISVTDGLEPNDDPESAPAIDAEVLYRAVVGPDPDFFRFTAKPHRRIVITLFPETGADLDLGVYRQTGANLAPGSPSKVTLQHVPIADDGQEMQAESAAKAPQTVADVPLASIPLASIPLSSISASRGGATETVQLTTGAVAEDLTIQATGYNGASGIGVLRVRQFAVPQPPPCATRTLPHSGVSGALPPTGTLPADTDTLLLFPQDRFGATHGPAEAATIRGKLDELASQAGLGYHAAVLPIDGSTAVAAAYDAWDASPCAVDAANDVVAAISGVIRGYLDAQPHLRDTLRNVVLVGADDVLPMARVPDLSDIANERQHADAVTTANREDTPQSAALRDGFVLTDDVYGDLDPIRYRSELLYVPDLAIGRLVETPGQISAAVDRFLSSDGRLSPSTALTTGYDFIGDGALEIDEALSSGINDRSRLINEQWDRQTLSDQLFPAGGSPGVAAINAHYDHYRLLPAAGNTTGDDSDLFTTADVAAQPAGTLAGRVLFSMGCHGGLNVPDTYRSSLDWAQAYAEQEAIWLANSGYGYGDTAAVALSERLMVLFAERLDGAFTAGDAVRWAKQEYFAGIGAYDDYDAKVLMEASLFGLPMYRIGDTAEPPPPQSPQTEVDPRFGGLEAATISLAPTYETKGDSLGTSYLRTPGVFPEVTGGYPILPRSEHDVTHASGRLAHGAVITGLKTSSRVGQTTFARPVIDLAAHEPVVASPTAFPTVKQNITTYRSRDGVRQRLNFISARWFPDSDPTTRANVGTTVFDQAAEVSVLYSDSSDFDQPDVTRVSAITGGDTVSFQVSAADESGIAAVTVLYVDDTGAWRFLPLEPGPDDTYVGSGEAAGAVSYEVSVVDAAGNVTVSTDKGAMWEAIAGDGAPRVTIGHDVAIPADGVFRADGTYTALASEDELTATVDYGEGDGTHPLAIAGGKFELEHAYTSGGTYEILVEICDSDGRCGIATVTVTVTSGIGKVIPVFECIVSNSDGTSRMAFGYDNPNPFPLSVAIGKDNNFLQKPADRGQPERFEPGRVHDVFAVTITSGNLNWKLQGTTSSSANSPVCHS